jgi:hypothetical protein
VIVTSLFRDLVDRSGLVAIRRSAALTCSLALGQDAASRGVHAFNCLALLDFRHRCNVVLGVLESGLWELDAIEL